MRSRRGGCVVTRPSHHPARLRGHPSSGRRGIHIIEGSVIPRPIKGGVFIDVKAIFDAARLRAAGIGLRRL